MKQRDSLSVGMKHEMFRFGLGRVARQRACGGGAQRTIHARRSKSLLALAAVIVASASAHSAYAVTCPSVETLTFPGRPGNAFSVKMYSDTQFDYVFVIDPGAGVYQYTKPSNSSAGFGTGSGFISGSTQSFLAGPWGMLIGSGGTVTAYAQGAAGTVFTQSGPIPEPPQENQSANFGRLMSYDWRSNLLTVCDNALCYLYAQEGSDWRWLGRSLPITPSALGQGSSQSGLGYLVAAQGNSLQIWPYSLPSALPTTPQTLTAGSLAPWTVAPATLPDRALITVFGDSLATTYSDMATYAPSGAVTGSWSRVAAGTIVPTGSGTIALFASASNGAVVLGDANITPFEFARVSPAGQAAPLFGGGPLNVVELFQVNTQNTPTANDDTWSQVPLPTGVSQYGDSVAVDGACAAIGDSGSGTITLFPVASSLATLCCNNTQANCSWLGQGFWTCPNPSGVSSGVVVTIPTTVAQVGSATLSVEPCTDYLPGVNVTQPLKCMTVTTTGVDTSGPSTICFPRPALGSTENEVFRCDTMTTSVCGAGENPYPPPTATTIPPSAARSSPRIRQPRYRDSTAP